MSGFNNDSGLIFTDISNEVYRTYVYRDGTKHTFQKPLYLNVSKSHGHRLFLEDGRSVYVRGGWDYVEWLAKNGQPNFCDRKDGELTTG